MGDRIEGHCHCGAVRVSVPAEASGVIACHCDDCQKLHGNFFALLAAPKADVTWTGEESIRWYDSSEKVRRSFCGNCGSRLAKDPKDKPQMLVSVGLFDRDLARRIVRHVMPEKKPDWYDLPKIEGGS